MDNEFMHRFEKKGNITCIKPHSQEVKNTTRGKLDEQRASWILQVYGRVCFGTITKLEADD